jgi:hypothetical protein
MSMTGETWTTAGAAVADDRALAADLPPFETNYAVQWRGMQAGTSSFSFKRQESDQWTYESRSSPRGVFKAFLPDSLTQHSQMRIDDAGVQPLRYRADDGTSATKRDIDLQFDWPQLRVSGVSEDQPVAAPLVAGVQDDLSVQIALMLELSRGQTPASFKTFNDRGLREYQYRREAEETLQTPLGAIATVVYSSQRAGSNRVTRYWCAPSLGYLPLKAQQKRAERVEWTMEIRTLSRS